MKLLIGIGLGALLLGACAEELDFNAPVKLGEMESVGNYQEQEAGPVALRRLTQEQFKNTVRQLFGDEVVIPKLSEPDAKVDGLLSVGASYTAFSPRGIESFEGVAYSLAGQAIETGAFQSYLPCTPGDSVDAGCARAFVEKFGRLAWRRTLTNEEDAALTEVANEAALTLDTFEGGLEFAIATILQSPNFLFRVELGGTPADGSRREFSQLELASRLSFFLWNSAPDATLLGAAEDGVLETREGLFAQAVRLLDAPQARQGIRNFFNEQLELYELDSLSKDPKIFEHFHRDLGKDARDETLQLLEYLVFDENADFRDVMTTEYSFINRRLAALYSIPSPTVEGFAYVKLPGEQRSGLLGHASFLGLHSHPVSSSATLRGRAVRTILLCQSIPAPPVNVDTSIPEPTGTTRTLRERVAEHLASPSCAGCHQLTDPIGLGLENFDGLGRWREKDHGAVIDPSGELDGEAFADMQELGRALRNHPAFAPCVVKTLARYAVGRATTGQESSWLKTLSERFEHHGFRFKRLILEIVMSPLFRQAGPLRELEEQL